MRTETSMPQAMRAQLCAFLSPKAFLRRDRGEGLFVTNAPVFDPGLNRIPGFLLERQGTLLRILPDGSWIARLEDKHPQPPNHLCATLLRFRGMQPDQNNLLLFVQGVKLLDTGYTPSPAEIAAYDRTLRQRCAEALRGGTDGGGLYAAAIILSQINTLYKGEEYK